MVVAVSFLALAVLFTALGQLLYKLSFVHNKRYFLALAIFAFLFVPLFNYRALMDLTIDTVYLATSAIVVLVLLFSSVFLKERINKQRIVGAIFIILGITLYNL